jgi:MFS family permease
MATLFLQALRGDSRPVPVELRSNFRHLYFDILWYGVLAGSAISFLTVYATRIGADSLQIGLLTAGPAIINLMFTLPTGRWLETRPIGPAVFWSSVAHRFFYLIWVVIPWLLLPQLQLWMYIVVTLVMTIPGTALAIGFNALFADAVPSEWRGHVAGIRNAVLSVAFIAASLISGVILERLPFPTGYQIVFAIGLVGAIMSSIHLAFVRPLSDGRQQRRAWHRLGDLASPGGVHSPVEGTRASVGERFLTRSGGRSMLRLEILAGPFGIVLTGLFFFHLAQYLAIPLFPLYWVNKLDFSDGLISQGQALFYAAVFIGSTQLSRVTKRYGNQRVLAGGVLGLAAYPAVTSIMQGPALYLVVSVMGGLAWSMVGGAIGNYVLERSPEDDRPAHLAWYNLALNAAILLGSLLGPLMADWVGLSLALMLAAAARAAAGLFIWRKG